MPGNDPRHTFIPKTAAAMSGAAQKKSRSFGLFFTVSLIVFILTALAALGAYTYRAYLTTRVSNLSATLERAKAAFEPETILALKRFNARTEAADALLARHIAPSVFFGVLQDLTVQSIRFSKFSYSFDGTKIGVVMSGSANNYSSVALQSEVFAKSPYVKNPIFSNLNLDRFGSVTFDVLLSVDPALLLYKEVAARGSSSSLQQLSPPAPTQ